MRRAADGSRLDYVDAGMGMFHTQIHATAAVFFAHLGTEDDDFSLSNWISELSRPKGRMWDKQKKHVKDFRECAQFIDIICNGYIIAALAKRCGFEGSRATEQFVHALPEISSDALSAAIDDLVDSLSASFNSVGNERAKAEAMRDMQHENYLIFMQQALVLRNFGLSMRRGDPGMLLVSFAYFTLWFQSSSKHKYARETVHLTACLAKIWSPDLIRFWMNNCLINPSGKKESWMACDYLGEHIVAAVQGFMHNTINEKTSEFLRLTLSPLIMMFRGLRKQMQEACGFYRSTHSSAVPTHEEVKKIAALVLKEGICSHVPGRLDTREAPDMYEKGYKEMTSCKPLDAYVKDMKVRMGKFSMSGVELEGPDEDVINDDDDCQDEEGEQFEFDDDLSGLLGDEDDLDIDV
jgi:hypothetical protein